MSSNLYRSNPHTALERHLADRYIDSCYNPDNLREALIDAIIQRDRMHRRLTNKEEEAAMRGAETISHLHSKIMKLEMEVRMSNKYTLLDLHKKKHNAIKKHYLEGNVEKLEQLLGITKE